MVQKGKGCGEDTKGRVSGLSQFSGCPPRGGVDGGVFFLQHLDIAVP